MRQQKPEQDEEEQEKPRAEQEEAGEARAEQGGAGKTKSKSHWYAASTISDCKISDQLHRYEIYLVPSSHKFECEVVVMAVFQQHGIKDVSRSQLFGAMRVLCSQEVKRKHRATDKTSLLLPVAKAFISRGICAVSIGADIGKLVPSDVKKVETF